MLVPVEPVYSVEKVAEHLDVSTKTVLAMLKDGRLRGRKVGREWRIPESALTEFFSAPEPNPGDDPGEDQSQG